MNIKEFRQRIAIAFESAGFQRQRRRTTQATIWTIPGDGVDRLLWEHAIRRPWGLLLSGSLAVDVPTFRAWLEKRFDRADHGLLWSTISSRHIANDPDLFFASETGEEPPAGSWAKLIRDKLEGLPTTIPELLQTWRGDRARLQPIWGPDDLSEASFQYLELWDSAEDLPLPPPAMTPTGRLDPDRQAMLQEYRNKISA